MSGAEVQLRPAVIEDAATIFQWRNDPFIIAKGTQQRSVTRDEHQAWFTGFLADSTCRMYLIHINREPAGQVRFDGLEGGDAEVSIYLLERFTGRGFGVMALRKACWELFASSCVERVLAFVRTENAPSCRAFKKAGFSLVEANDSSPANHHALAFKRPALVPHNRLTHGEPEAMAAVEAVRSGQWTSGPRVAMLETAIAARVGVRHAVAVASGLGALRLTLLGLGIHAGDKVLVPGYSCVALANAVLACGACPVPMDVCANDWNFDPRDAQNAREAEHPQAVIAVNTFGAPAEIEALRDWDLPVIEDCAHGFVADKPGVRCTAAVLSFHATKLLGAGEGGMVLSDSDELSARIRAWRDYSDQPPDGTRLNEQMSDLEAAVALCQLERLDAMLASRHALAESYHAQLDVPGLAGHCYQLPCVTTGRVWYRYAVELLEAGARELIDHLKRYDIGAAEPICAWRPAGARPCPTADRAYRRVVSLPLYPTLTKLEQDRVIHAFLRYWS
jgi:dTDP-4-amino-4,6-dideoxygalactose transaminase/L-amino acid N-acyltransferase YncA